MRSLDSIKKIIIHCSDSEFGDINLINQWHRERGFLGCGYHYVILNGVPTHGKPYNPKLDGVLQEGRMLREIGAHCKNHNHDSIGICLIGKHHFSAAQLYQALPSLLLTLGDLGLTAENVYGHRDFDLHKTCPNFDVNWLKGFLWNNATKALSHKDEVTGKKIKS